MILERLRKFWHYLIGDSEKFPPEQRAFNVVSIITTALILILIPLNISFSLWVVSVMLIVIETVLVILYIRSRAYGKYTYSLLIYAIASYIVIIITFLYNSGSNGPALYLFLLTYLFLIAFTNHRLHRTWTLLHLLIPVSLVCIEYFFPEVLTATYVSATDRYLDIITSFIVIVVCTYSITIYLRFNYERERSVSESHARKIEEQNKQIGMQNALLKKSNSDKLRLISILAHDLRNPMNAIIGVLEILADQELSTELEKELKNELLITTRSTAAMLDNLLSWTSSQIKGLKPIPTKVKPDIVINQVLEVQRLIANKKGIAMRTSLDNDVTIWADFDMLELIIRNLVGNALKFTPKNGTVEILLTKDLDTPTCTLAVHDNGIGIASEDLKRLFDGDVQSTYGTEAEKGIGLGLFLCKELTALNHGKMWVQSTFGEGSTFFAAFPLHQDKPSLHSLINN